MTTKRPVVSRPTRTRAISPRNALRLLAAIGLVALVRLPMGDNLSGLEAVWLTLTWGGVVGCAWGLWKATRSSVYVTHEQHENPELDYASARISALNHIVTHGVLLLTQLAWFSFGVRVGFQAAAPSAPGRPTGTQIHFTAVLLFMELLLVGLSIFMVIRRQALVDSVARVGGD